MFTVFAFCCCSCFGNNAEVVDAVPVAFIAIVIGGWTVSKAVQFCGCNKIKLWRFIKSYFKFCQQSLSFYSTISVVYIYIVVCVRV